MRRLNDPFLFRLRRCNGDGGVLLFVRRDWPYLRRVRAFDDLLWTSFQTLQPEPQSESEQQHRYRCSNRQRRRITTKETSPATHLQSGWDFQWPRLIAKCAENLFQLLNLRIGFAGLVPQVVCVVFQI